MKAKFINNLNSITLRSFIESNHSLDLILNKVTVISKNFTGSAVQDKSLVVSNDFVIGRTVELVNPDTVPYSRGKLNVDKLFAMVDSLPKGSLIVIDNLFECIQFHDKGGFRLINILMRMFNSDMRFVVTYDSAEMAKQLRNDESRFYISDNTSSKEVFTALTSSRLPLIDFDEVNFELNPCDEHVTVIEEEIVHAPHYFIERMYVTLLKTVSIPTSWINKKFKIRIYNLNLSNDSDQLSTNNMKLVI